MNQSKHKIAIHQLFFIMILMFNGAYSLMMPNILGRQIKGADGMICIFAAFVLGLVVLLLVSFIAKRAPEEGLVDYLPKVLGKFLGKIFGFGFAIYFTYTAILYLRCFDEMLAAELLPNTPRWVLSLALLCLVLWIINNGLEDIARFYNLVAPIVLLMLVLVLLANGDNIFLYNALPFGESEPIKILTGTRSVFPIFLVNVCLLVVYPAINQKDKVFITALLATVLSSLYLIAMFFVVLAVFGGEGGLKIVWPLIELARMIRIGPFLERVEALFILVWFSIVFLNGSFLVYCGAISWRSLFNVQKAKILNGVVVAAIFGIGLFAKDLSGVLAMQYVFSHYMAFVVVLMLLITAFGVWRYQRRDAHE